MSSAVNSPVAFFAFNRPRHAARALAALAANPEAADTDLHVFVDGPRDAADAALVDEVATLAAGHGGFRTVTLHRAERNRGLFRAITGGVDAVVRQAGRVIVLEDDLIVSRHFLRFMNDALDRYQDAPAVGSLHAWCPPASSLPEYYFLQGGDCWGWATWSDRWALFNPDAAAVLRGVAERGLRNFASSHGWQSVIQLVRRAQGRNQSWAILWHASLFLAERYTLHPGRSFVDNIGHDGTGAHSKSSTVFATALRDDYHAPAVSLVRQDPAAARALSGFLDGLATGSPGRAARFALSLYARALAWRQVRR